MLTAKQVMARLNLGRTTVYGLGRRYLESGGAEGLPCRKFGRALRFPADELDEWVKADHPTRVDAEHPARVEARRRVESRPKPVRRRSQPEPSRPAQSQSAPAESTATTDPVDAHAEADVEPTQLSLLESA